MHLERYDDKSLIEELAKRGIGATKLKEFWLKELSNQELYDEIDRRKDELQARIVADNAAAESDAQAQAEAEAQASADMERDQAAEVVEAEAAAAEARAMADAEADEHHEDYEGR